MHFETEAAQRHLASSMNKSVENLLISSHEVISSINSSGLGNQGAATTLGSVATENAQETLGSSVERSSPVSSPNLSPRPSPRAHSRREYSRLNSDSSVKESLRANKSDDQLSQDLINRSSDSADVNKTSAHENKKETRSSDRTKKKSSWYNVLYPTYKSRSEDFRRIFKDVPDDERLVPMSMAEMWQLVHTCYGDELGLTSDDEDYVPPLPAADEEKLSTRLSVESFSETEAVAMENSTSLPTEPASAESAPTTELQVQPPTPSIPKPESVLDPTDLSDTTESEAEKHGLKMNIRSTMVCTSLHEGRQVNKATLPIYIDQLFTLLFTNSKFFLDFHTSRKTTDLVQSAWTQNDETGQKMRTISYTMPLSQAIGPRTCHVTEMQVMLPCSRPGHLYCIDVDCINAGVPYADSFSVSTHYCMSNISENETTLTIYSQIKYKKSMWGFMKIPYLSKVSASDIHDVQDETLRNKWRIFLMTKIGVIEKNCWAGLEDYTNSLIKALTLESEEGTESGGIKRKTRKRRRATGVGATLQTHASEHISANHQISPSNLPHVHTANARGDTNIILSSMLLVAVLCLMVINGLLYYKLWGLEETAAYTIMDLHVLKNTPKTEEDWINLLQQQESLHNVEMRKWQRVLHTAAQLLRQTEESLTELQMSIHPTATEKMFSVLKPNLKSLNTHTERRGKTEM
ncbi:PREDICTED: GRAM domain-containing protein 1B-like isoform X4 [Vollenhovia emeryi]|uniref:GRAM domain-containing protein 1B-like isoform X4 n=1 Tax=Vollenhovia emeryi TaxID=411798 RepID=UPI0005F3A8F7|nr:PREDICTED: GRAM domain-containing protein 1B-like isoform X4 [Vollenhovia emeryi]